MKAPVTTGARRCAYNPRAERILFRTRVHRATVTQTDLDYTGSVIIAAYGNSSAEARTLKPRVVPVDTNNRGLDSSPLESPLERTNPAWEA